MMKKLTTPLCLLILLLGSGRPIHGERLILDLWCELEPMVFEGSEYPVSPETAARRILEEAKTLFSAMIYGYRFTYVPYDRARGVADFFELTLLGEIVWGDPNLMVLAIETRDKRLYGKIAYSMADYQESRRTSWGSNTLPTASGMGEKNLLEGIPAKLKAFEEAIKQAIRGYARTRHFNKPKEITGEVLLWNQPHTIINAGAYSTQAKVKLSIRSITPYTVY